MLSQWRLVPAPQTMKAHSVRNIVFSSSATVYGDPKYLPLDENHPVGGCTNPYGKSKYFIEEMIRDLCKAERVRSCPKACKAGNRGLFPLECAGGTRQHCTAPSPGSHVCVSPQDWNAVLLRYFNPIGAHESGMIGEDPQGIPNNLMPYVAQVLPCCSPRLMVPVWGTG